MKSGTGKNWNSFLNTDIQWSVLKNRLIKTILLKKDETCGCEASFCPVAIEKEELVTYTTLIQAGISSKDAIPFSFSQSDQILEHLQQGESFEKILLNTLNKEMRSLAGFLSFMNVSQAIEAQEKLQQSKAEIEKKLFVKAAYPLFLLVFSTVLLWLFVRVLMPSMSSFGADDLQGFFNGLLAVFILYLIVIVLCIMGYAIYMYTSWSFTPLRTFLCRFSIFRILLSSELALLLQVVLESGCSTIQAIVKMDTLPLSFCARKQILAWQKQLEKGKTLDQALMKQALDPMFLLFFRLGLQSDQMKSCMEKARELMLLKIQKKAKRLYTFLQISAYICSGTLLLSVYQVMMMPMNMLYSF